MVSELALNGVEVTYDGNKHVNMHHKFAVIDSHTLLTGSFNWTAQAAAKNQENLVVMRESHLIPEFETEFESLWRQFKKNKVTDSRAISDIQMSEKKNKERA